MNSWIDPDMQKQLLLGKSDPNSLLEVQNRPLSAPQAPQGVGMGQPSMSPYGPPMASQGMPQIDPRLQQQSQFYQGLDMLAGLGRRGRNTGYNPAQQQMDQQMANYKLQSDRMRAIQQDRDTNQDPLVRGIQQYAIAAGIQDKPWDEQVKAYKAAKFAPERRTAAEKDTEFLMTATPEERAAYFARKGVKTETMADGSLVAVRDDGSYEVLFDSEGQIQGAAEMAAAKGQATGEAKIDWEVVGNVETNLYTLADEWEAAQYGIERGREALSMLAEGEVDPGLISGLVLDYLGIGSSRLAYFQNLSQQQIFEELANATLTPVSDADIRALAKLFTSAYQSPEVAKGNLEAFLSRKEREQERKSGRMRREISRVKDGGYRSGLLQTYQPFVDFKAITSWDDVPGGE